MTELFLNFTLLFDLNSIFIHAGAHPEYFIAGSPILFGLIASIIHVIAGPDHLAAISPLALNAKYKPWFIGMSWGVGHVAGMLLLGLIFFFFRDLIPIEFISNNSERIVGILLVAIGVWALAKAANYRKDNHSHIHTHTNEDGNAYVHNHTHKHANKHQHTADIAKEKQTYWAAAGIGIIHGFAGVSHIVSMLPTLAFETNYEAIMYLIGFGFGTIIAMVVFSFALGVMAKTASKQKKDRLFIGINALAGFAAIFVGILWMWNVWQ